LAGWDGDRLVLTENRDIQLHTIYHPGSFVPLLRAEHARAEDSHRTLAEKLEEDAGGVFPPDVHERFNVIEQEIRRNQVSEANHQWLASVSLKAENIALWVDPLPESHEMALHLFHCDHLGTPVGLINHKNGKVEWNADLDVWGNVQSCDNPHKLRQPIRMQGQQFDEESGLHYNRHRYYDPAQGRYITQDPIGLMGGMNPYRYTSNPLIRIDPLGLVTNIYVGGPTDINVSISPSESEGNPFGHVAMGFPDLGDNGLYSYATRNPWGSSISAYLDKQSKYRNTTVYKLNTTQEQERKMREYIESNYKENNSDYSKLSHTCGTMVIDAMHYAGVDDDVIIQAISLGMPAFLPETVEWIAINASGKKGEVIQRK
jgi:RHS repeat-associated protein